MPQNAFTPGQFAIIENAWLELYPSKAHAERNGQSNPMRIHGMQTHDLRPLGLDSHEVISITIKMHRDLSWYRLWIRVSNFCNTHDLIHTIYDAKEDWVIIHMRPARF